MAHVFSPAGSSAFGSGLRSGRRMGRRSRSGIDWRIVLMTAASAVMLIATLGQPHA